MAFTLDKQISRGSVSAGSPESIGSFNVIGRNTAETLSVPYGQIDVQCTNPGSGTAAGRINFNVARASGVPTLLALDGDQLEVRIPNGYLISNGIQNNSGSIIDIATAADIAANTNMILYSISSASYPVYPQFVNVTTAGAITKQTTATLITQSAYTVPLAGYYSFTAQVSLGTVGTIVAEDTLSIYADLSGGAVTPIAGSISLIDVAENSANAINQVVSGMFMQKFAVGDVIQFYHIEGGSAWTFGSGTVQVAYMYQGNNGNL